MFSHLLLRLGLREDASARLATQLANTTFYACWGLLFTERIFCQQQGPSCVAGDEMSPTLSPKPQQTSCIVDYTPGSGPDEFDG